MDSLTHALAAAAGCALIGRPELIPFAVLGAVGPDVDAAFQRFSDRDARLYLFTHGGITHSVLGATVVGGLLAGASWLLFPFLVPATGEISPFLALLVGLAGAASHLLLDYIAYPGIPLFYPLTDRKYTLGLLAGPSPFLMLASLGYAGFLMTGKASLQEPWLYGGIFLGILGIHAALKLYVHTRIQGVLIPGFLPVTWLAIKDTPEKVEVSSYHLWRGLLTSASYPKGRAPEVDQSPELRRMRYHSYAVIASETAGGVRFSDPVREGGHLWYPPYYKAVMVPAEKAPDR